jgi:hypothetical protein
MQKSRGSCLVLGVATTSITTLALFVGTNSAQAAITQFSDLSSFQAGTSGLTTIDFEGLAPAGGFSYYDPNLTVSGVSFTDSNVSAYVVDSAFQPSNYNWGSGAVLLGSKDGLPNGTITAALPSGVTAIGSDIMSFDSYASPFSITLSTGETFTVGSLNYPDRKFVGFTSDTAISSISFQATNGYTLLDNFRFGTAGAAPAPTAVPEPFTMIGTFVGGTAAMRMRKKLKSASK